MIEEYTIKGRSVDTEDTRANGIAEEIVEGFVINMCHEHPKYGL